MFKKVRLLIKKLHPIKTLCRHGSLLLFICVMAVAACGRLNDGADEFGTLLADTETGCNAQTTESQSELGMTMLQSASEITESQSSAQKSNSQSEVRADDAQKASDDNLSADDVQKASDDDLSADDAEKVYVYVCGWVKHPGVYALDIGSRQVAAVEAAGGMLPEACADGMNLAAIVADGERIYVPSMDEAAAGLTQSMQSLQGVSESGLVNINTATKEELMTLSGIGESKALRIIEYRESQGSFQNIEALKNVPGIKDGTYDALKDQITVG